MREEKCCLLSWNISFRFKAIQVFKICKLQFNDIIHSTKLWSNVMKKDISAYNKLQSRKLKFDLIRIRAYLQPMSITMNVPILVEGCTNHVNIHQLVQMSIALIKIHHCTNKTLHNKLYYKKRQFMWVRAERVWRIWYSQFVSKMFSFILLNVLHNLSLSFVTMATYWVPDFPNLNNFLATFRDSFWYLVPHMCDPATIMSSWPRFNVFRDENH